MYAPSLGVVGYEVFASKIMALALTESGDGVRISSKELADRKLVGTDEDGFAHIRRPASRSHLPRVAWYAT